ncbi:anthranilate phosphoribosyltransferase [Tepidiforma sp.]|jgi:anthranilate phosphoribosyltransferase|uniref:anthranilate phosphoribosyltransferase n=1 Tax=Tepidiforma sp. TaxID=2682230 RepID=UPI0026288320|nr:anthranilate phosphoribosyltransferase [Tepidiforma sp.]MCX7617305.1 anthranilate phosphoribosyltransferase [Tepidiforma sp.]
MAVQEAIKTLVDAGDLPPPLAAAALEELMTGAATPAQVGAFLAAWRIRGETPAAIAACLGVMLRHAEPVRAPDTIDICGTGGDGIDTINVSTAAGFVVAACGVRVAKHGNRAASSKCGSADVLEALGARIDVDGAAIARIIDACGFCFLFAQRMHPAMRHVGGARREIGIRTAFNILGPLSNPAMPSRQLVGVGARALGPLVAEALALRGIERALVVHSEDGLDEISPAAPTLAWVVGDGAVAERVLTPADFGVAPSPLAAVAGGDAAANAGDILAILDGAEGPKTDFTVINAAAALVVAGRAADFREGAALARDAIATGRAREVLDAYVALSREAAGG